VYEYLLGVTPKRITTSQRQYLAQRAKPLVFQKGKLHKFRQDNRFYRVLQPEQLSTILQELHGGVEGRHLFTDITV
jgi:hypothetical protein